MAPFFAEFHGDPGGPNVLILPALLCFGLAVAFLASLGSKLAQKYPARVGLWMIITLVLAFCVYFLCLPLTLAGPPDAGGPVMTEAPSAAGASRSAH